MNQIAEAIKGYYEKAQLLWKIQDWPQPTFSLDLRGKTAGKAFYLQNHIKLNRTLYHENVDEFCRSTVGHEVSHLVVYRRFGFDAATNKEHGEEWASIMDGFLLDPDPCHTYKLTKVKRLKIRYEYICSCAAHFLTEREHRVAQSGIQENLCKFCKKKLTYIPKVLF